MKKNILSLILWLTSFQLIGAFMGMITKSNIKDWYQSLIKSPLTPPDITFGIVWTILYILLALIGWSLFTKDKQHSLQMPRVIFAVQMLLNWLWSPVFFYYHFIGSALAIILLMVLLNALFFFVTIKVKPKLAYAIVPYFIWLSFAAYLNGFIYSNL